LLGRDVSGQCTHEPKHAHDCSDE